MYHQPSLNPPQQDSSVGSVILLLVFVKKHLKMFDQTAVPVPRPGPGQARPPVAGVQLELRLDPVGEAAGPPARHLAGFRTSGYPRPELSGTT